MCCYERLRFHILDDPFYTWHGRHVLQRQGMFRWLKSVQIFNTPLTFEAASSATDQSATDQTDQDVSSPLCWLGEGVKNKLAALLAGIVLTIYNGGEW